MEITSKNIIEAFRQGIVTNVPAGPAGNCVSVALIKGCIDCFGVGNVFQSTRTADGYDIKFRNGAALSITDTEVAQATAESKFVAGTPSADLSRELIDRLLSYANFCYAVMARNILVLGEGGNKPADFSQALVYINNGLNTSTSYHYLGLNDHNFIKLPLSYPIKHKRCIVAYGTLFFHHAVYAAFGDYDKEGVAANILGFFPHRHQVVD